MSVLRRVFVVAALALTVAACHRHGGSAANGAHVLTATIGYPEPHTMFAPGGGGGGPAFTSSKVLEHLVILRKDQTFAPALATSWTFAPDSQSITFELRPNVKWHDGQPFTADDVAFSITDYWKPYSPGTVLGFLKGVEVTNPHEIIVHFNRPVPQFSALSVLGGANANYVLPKHIYAGTDILLNPANNAPIGTGPWIFTKWVRGSYAEFRKNPDYWVPGEPKLDRLIIRWWRDPASRAAALETGEVDIGVSNPVPLGDLTRLQANPNLKVNFDPQGLAVGLHFNVRNPIYSDKRVRQALLYAVDRDFIAKTIYGGFAKPAIGPILSSNKLYFTTDVPQYPYDPAKAARLLDEAGYPVKADGKRFKMNLLASGWSEENGKVGLYLKQVFDDLHIDTTLRVPDRPNSLKALYTDYDFDVAYSQGGGSASDPVPELTMLYTSGGIAKGLLFRNASRYSTPQMDDLVKRITTEVDPSKRRDLIHEFARLAGEEVPVFPIVEWPSHTVMQKDIQIDDNVLSQSADPWGNISKSER